MTVPGRNQRLIQKSIIKKNAFNIGQAVVKLCPKLSGGVAAIEGQASDTQACV